LATKFGLTYISAGELLRDKLGADVAKGDLADDQKVSGAVLEAVKQAKSLMQGFVLDGFPRTRMQASILQEHAIVPTHVLVLKAGGDKILERHAMIRDGALQGDYIEPKVLDAKLNQYTCHSSAALETYASKIKVIDAFAPPQYVASEMERIVRMLPRSKGLGCPPRVLILGPRGSGAREHASRLAARLGAVFVDGERLQSSSSSRQGGYRQDVTTSIDLEKEKLASAASEDLLGEIGVRLRMPDCKSQGYVMCGFVNTPETARVLAEDSYLCPTRIVALRASVDVCVARLRNVAVDKVTGKIWTFRPRDENIRQRLQKNKEDMPAAVAASAQAYAENLPQIIQALAQPRNDGRCLEIQADGAPEDVFINVVEFVERPLPLGSSPKSLAAP
jgi:adenylate kinase